jgi:glycosyltransferase involved in cell wall biosynthesis
MSILMVVRYFHPWAGGAERQAQRLAKKLIGRGGKVTVVTGWWFRRTSRKEIVDTVPISRNFTCWGMFDIKGVRKFGAYIYMLTLFAYLVRHRREYDILHVHLANYHAFVSLVAARLLGKKIIIKIGNTGEWGIRAMKEGRGQGIWGMERMFVSLRHSDCIVAVNPAITGELVAEGFAADKIVEIPNGIETDMFESKADYGLNSQCVLTFVGRLHPQKGVDVLLRSVHQVYQVQSEMNWRLQVLGDGRLRDQLEALARNLGIAEAVDFCGQVDNVEDYLAGSDIFVLPSRTEGISNALLEAMACGLPCIATRIDGNRHVLTDGYDGLLVTPDDVDELAQAIIRLSQDTTLRRRIGKQARHTAQVRYSLDVVATKYVELYELLLNGDPQ